MSDEKRKLFTCCVDYVASRVDEVVKILRFSIKRRSYVRLGFWSGRVGPLKF
jgi:hypothetical protein